MSRGEKQTITVPYIAPIPAGHRIELRYFWDEKGVFKKQRILNTDIPLIRDLDTGIEYGHMDHYKKTLGASEVPNPPHNYPLDTRADLEWADVVVARVVSCRVLTEAFSTVFQAQTTLVIETEH